MSVAASPIRDLMDYLFRSRWMRAVAWPLSHVYRAGLAMRKEHAPETVGVPVISVGNIHVGGTGKTPFVIELARTLTAAGRRPVVVSRGYAGRLSGSGAVVQPEQTAADVGDEPKEIATACPETPVVIGADRIAACRRAETLGDCIILDDGFQHRRVARMLDLALLPADSRPSTERLLPLGRLREPPTALHRATAVVFMHEDREPAVAPEEIRLAWAPYLRGKVLHATRVIVGVRAYRGTVEPTALLGRKVVAFSGIARPERFHRHLEHAGAHVIESLALADHHDFTAAEIETVRRMTEYHDAIAVTTEKDAARLDERPLPFPCAVLRSRIVCPQLLETILPVLGS